jgi:tRNA threonylcarbamoyladenosine biosynthesis protein TsaB
MQFLVAQSTHDEIQVGFFSHSLLTAQRSIPKFNACQQLTFVINDIVKQHVTDSSHLDFIGINQGPAPFNTLRALISSANGIAFATQIPLVGANGLKALYTTSRAAQPVVLLNAFNQEVYYAYKKQADLALGVAKFDEIIPAILLHMPHGVITFLGNGSRMYQKQIVTAFGKRAEFQTSDTAVNLPLEVLGRICLNKFKQGEHVFALTPLYLKRAVQERSH